jgi:Tol biopolymer transport system component
MVGRTISHYAILEKLGECGMGVVYKARDTHLDRFVAIKVLPPEKVADAERKRRFVQEAKSASALNHPNIITIYDIANENGVDFISMEYVPGRALNQLISRKGLPLSEALKYAVQIADALTAAHAAGIIHRDLKPGNVMVSGAPERSGFVKVLDFGLAKLTDTVDTNEREFTETMQQGNAPATGEGTIVGTVSYMSPEQAEGKKVDGRSDIFSFGALLYEMVTGRRAFQGDSKLSTLSAILREEPKPASQVVQGVPRDLEKIVARCLRKSPERRFQTMADLKVALEELKEESDSGTLSAAVVPVRPRSRQLGWAATLVGTIAVGGTLWFVRQVTRAPEPAPTALPLTTYPGFETDPSFSPDGNQVAFTWDGEKRDNDDIYVKLIGTGGPPLRLSTDPASDFSPAWSPDGRFIAFLRELSPEKTAVLLIPALGGPERKLAAISTPEPDSLPSPFMEWSPDGNWLVVSDKASETEPSVLYLLSTETGERRRLTFPPLHSLGDSCPTFSPDGRALVFSRNADSTIGELYLLALSAGLKPTGEAQRLTLGPADKAASFISSTRDDASPQFSVDGKRIAFVSNRSGSPEIWAINSDGSNAVQLTSFAGPSVTTPRWSPDGERIAFDSNAAGEFDIWIVGASGGKPERMTIDPANDGDPSWSHDGQWIYFDSARAGAQQVWKIPASGGEAIQVTRDGGYAPVESPDGKFLYYVKRQTATSLWKIPLQGGQPIEVLESLNDYLNLAIVPSGVYFVPLRQAAHTRVFSYPGSSIQFLDFGTGQIRTIANFDKAISLYGGTDGLAVSPDGRWILYTQIEQAGSELMLVENFR